MIDKLRFKEQLKEVLKSSYLKVKNIQDIFQFGIRTDGDINSIVICYNTLSHYEELNQYTLLKYSTSYKESKWITAEWFDDTLGNENKILNELNLNLFNFIYDDHSYVDGMLDLFAESLIEFKNDNLFDLSPDLIIYIDVSDCEIDEKMLIRLKKMLGNELHYNQFIEDLDDL